MALATMPPHSGLAPPTGDRLVDVDANSLDLELGIVAIEQRLENCAECETPGLKRVKRRLEAELADTLTE